MHRAGSGGGAGDGVAFDTHVPSLRSCQGKHFSVLSWSDWACAGTAMKKEQIEIAAAAKKRVMSNPSPSQKIGLQNSLRESGFASQAKAYDRSSIGRRKAALYLKYQGLPHRRSADKTAP
jgi:hypothetical protein